MYTENEMQHEENMACCVADYLPVLHSDINSLGLDKICEICIKKGLGENKIRRVLWRRVLLGLDELQGENTVKNSQSQCCDDDISDDVNTQSLHCGGRRGSCNVDLAVSEKKSDDESAVLGGVTDNCQPRVIGVDVKRSLWLLYPDSDIRSDRRRRLEQILLSVLKRNVERHYYQGLHELMGFIMYVMEGVSQNTVVALCERLLQVQWRSFSDKGLGQSQSMLYAVHALVAREDVELATRLEFCGVAPESHYAVSWVITWYTHVCEDFNVLARLFDFLIVQSNENAVVFLTTALVLREKVRIMGWIQDVHESIGVDCDNDDGLILMARVYTLLVQLPKKILTTKNSAAVEEILRKATELKEKYSDSVLSMREDFLQGRVKKFGILADKRTRNSALKLLWLWLFREWREPWKGRYRVTTSLILCALVVVFAAFSHSEFFVLPRSLYMLLVRLFL